MATYQRIKYEKAGRIARVIANRPEYRNAQSRPMLGEMDAAFTEAAHDDEVRVIIMSGEGEHFSAGHDIGTKEEMDDRKNKHPYPAGLPSDYKRSWDIYNDMSLRWRDIQKPTIAQVHGYCIYAGWMIASCMDLIVASDDAKFLPAHFQYFSVPWDLPPRKAKEILWQARFVEAEEALELGFVNHVVPRDELASFTDDLAQQIARMDPFAARMVKFSVNQAQDAMGFRTAIQAAHSNFTLIQSASDREVPTDERGRPRMAGVNRAFKRQDETSADKP
jgi:enoyl-CoA hydratase